MRRLLTLFACVAVFAALALAEDYSGRLIDASCYNQHKSAATCDPTASTSSFGILVSGKVMKFDSAGNEKAAAALKSRADRSANPNSPASAEVTAKVTGTMEGDDTIKVESIDLQ